MDGVLVIDKPEGLTSHDVVAVARRLLGETRIGHTGTLDPIATGVLPLAIGRATRLVRFLSASEKDYDAQIHVGLGTDTYDITGREIVRSDRRPSRSEIGAALAAMTGDHLQPPPPYSAKKIGGRRAHELARADLAVQPAPVPVRLERVEIMDWTDDLVSIRLTCSAGFYVRSLAHALGERLGVGACLQSLRRTRSGEFRLADATMVATLHDDPDRVTSQVIPMARLLQDMPSATLTDEGVEWVSHGRIIERRHASGPLPERASWVRLMSRNGALVALGTPADQPGALHPSIVLI